MTREALFVDRVFIQFINTIAKCPDLDSVCRTGQTTGITWACGARIMAPCAHFISSIVKVTVIAQASLWNWEVPHGKSIAFCALVCCIDTLLTTVVAIKAWRRVCVRFTYAVFRCGESFDGRTAQARVGIWASLALCHAGLAWTADTIIVKAILTDTIGQIRCYPCGWVTCEACC